ASIAGVVAGAVYTFKEFKPVFELFGITQPGLASYLLLWFAILGLISLATLSWKLTPKLAIAGLSSQDLGTSRRIIIDIKNLSFTTDRFSVHVRVEKDGQKLWFGTLGRYSIKTEERELEYAQWCEPQSRSSRG
ncbi:MAG TPA: hypothetical protein VIV15_02600, partial [Anaerolineales bacterium]